MDITIDLAYRMRFLRGLEIGYKENYIYENERLKEIALRQSQLIPELAELDEELKLMYLKWEEEMLEQERAKDKRKAQFDRF